MNTSISTTYRSASAPRQKQPRDPGLTVDADEVGLVNPQSGLVTQEDANQYFNDKIDTLEADVTALDGRVTTLENVNVIDGGTY